VSWGIYAMRFGMSKGIQVVVSHLLVTGLNHPIKYSRPHSPDHYKRAQSPTKNGYQQSQLKNSHGPGGVMLDQHLQQNRLQDHIPVEQPIQTIKKSPAGYNNGPVSPLSPVHRSIFASQSVPIEKISKPVNGNTSPTRQLTSNTFEINSKMINQEANTNQRTNGYSTSIYEPVYRQKMGTKALQELKITDHQPVLIQFG